MPRFEGLAISDARDRKVVCFTKPSGVRAIVATDIPPAAPDKLVASLKCKFTRRRRRAEHCNP